MLYWPKTKLVANPFGAYGHLGSALKGNLRITGVFGYAEYPETPWIATDTIKTGMNSSVATLDANTNTKLYPGHTVRVDSEQMFIMDSSLTVERGVNGTTAASHSAAAVINVRRFPRAVSHAVTIYAMRCWKRKDSMYQNVVVNPQFGTVDVWKGDDPDWKDAVKKYMRHIGPPR